MPGRLIWWDRRHRRKRRGWSVRRRQRQSATLLAVEVVGSRRPCALGIAVLQQGERSRLLAAGPRLDESEEMHPLVFRLLQQRVDPPVVPAHQPERLEVANSAANHSRDGLRQKRRGKLTAPARIFAPLVGDHAGSEEIPRRDEQEAAAPKRKGNNGSKQKWDRTLRRRRRPHKSWRALAELQIAKWSGPTRR